MRECLHSKEYYIEIDRCDAERERDLGSNIRKDTDSRALLNKLAEVFIGSTDSRAL